MDNIDTARYFPNPAVVGNDSGDVVAALALSWTAERCWNVANQLLTRCIENANSTCSSSHHIRRQSSVSLGSLYVGDLGPLVYLRWRLSKFLLRSLSPSSPSSSTTTDNSGKAETLLQQAMHIVETSSSDDISQHHNKGLRRLTLLESPQVGARALHVVLLHQTGKTQQAAALASALIHSLDQACQQELLPRSECDVLYGRAGALQAILFLRSELQDPLLGSQTVLRLATAILTEGQSFAAAQQQANNIGTPLLWVWHLGAAHGVVGILQTLLSLSPFEIESLNHSHNMTALVKATIAKLDDFCFSPSGNLDSSIHLEDRNRRRHRSDRLVHWCHGAPGHALLLLKAHQVFGEEAYLQKAKRIADQVIWPRGLLRKGVGLCHGIAGNAYVLLELGKFDPQYIDKACFFANFALEHLRELEPVPDRPYSLYEGLGGLCALVMDLALPQDAKFPLYTF